MRVFPGLTAVIAVPVVEAVAHPEITPGPSIQVLKARQNTLFGAVNGFWSPYVDGSTTAYATEKCQPGEYVEASSNLWGCCTPGGNACQPPVSCFSGTLYYPTVSVVCANMTSNPTNTRCGTYYLYSSVGDSSPLTHLYCAAPSDKAAYSLYIEKPANAITSTTITPFQSNPNIPTATASPTNSSGSSKTNVGAIVGGVIGGLAVLAIIGIAIFLLFLRKKRKDSTLSKWQTTQQPSAGMAYPGHISQYAKEGAGMTVAGAVGGYVGQQGTEHQYQQSSGVPPLSATYIRQPMPQHRGYFGTGTQVQYQQAFGAPSPVELGATEIQPAEGGGGSAYPAEKGSMGSQAIR